MTMKNLLKNILITGTALTLVEVGEYTQPYNNLNRFVTYYNVPASDNTPIDYKRWHTKIKLDQGHATLYLGNGVNYKRVAQDGDVGSIKETINNYLNDTKRSADEYFDSVNWYNSFKEESARQYLNAKKKVEDWMKDDDKP